MFTPGLSIGIEDLRLLRVTLRIGIGLAHHDRDRAARIAERLKTTTCGR